ncbi:MAG: TonB-dependent receptor [Saprospiraceae bacterium]|nr:TonB-dependent receptor [Saprospiraceae bacterium]
MKKTINYIIMVIAFLLLSGNYAISQNATIKGVVLDLETNTPLKNVEVIITPSNKGSISNSQGIFAINDIKPGEYSIIINHLSYLDKYEKIKLMPGQIFEIKVILTPKIYKLDEFVIKGSMVKRAPYVKNTILREEIEQVAARDIGDYLRTIPNVGGIRKGGANLDPVIRGFKYSQLNIQINGGVKIEGGCPNRMDPTASHVEMDAIEAIEVIKGPYALRYGPSFGGVVNLITTNPKPYEKFEIHARGIKGYESNWNGNKEHMAIFGGNKHIFFLLAGSNQNYGSYYDGDGNQVRSSFRKFSYSAKLGFSPKENHKILFSYDESHGRDVLFAALPMDERDDDTKIYSFDYTARKISKTINSIDVKAYFSDVNHLMDNMQRSFSDTAAVPAYIEADKIGGRAEVGLNIGETGHLFVGADYTNTKKDGDRTKNMIGQYPAMGKVPVKVEDLWNNAEINNLGFFSEYKNKFGSFEFVAAARFDMNSASSDTIKLMGMPMMGNPPAVLIMNDSTDSEYTNLSFSAGISKKLNEKMSLGLSLGRGMRSPDMIERFIILLPVGYDNYEYMGNPNLKPEINNEVDLTFKFDDENKGAIEVNGFYSLVEDYITGRILPPTQQKPLTQTVFGVKEFYNTDKVNIWGFEIGYATPTQYKFGAKLIAAYTNATVAKLTKHEFDSTGNATNIVEVTNDPLSEVPPLEVNLDVHYKFLKGKIIPKAHLRWVADQNHVSTAFYEPETPGFTLLDMSVVYKHSKMVSVVGGVNNIFDLQYYEHLNRRVIGTSGRIYEPGRVFFVNLIINI